MSARARRRRERRELSLRASRGERADREHDARLPSPRHAHGLHAEEFGELVRVETLARRRGVLRRKSADLCQDRREQPAARQHHPHAAAHEADRGVARTAKPARRRLDPVQG
jgi:hypothetical protein